MCQYFRTELLRKHYEQELGKVSEQIVAARDLLEAFNVKRLKEDDIINEVRLQYDSMIMAADVSLQAANSTIKTVRKEIATWTRNHEKKYTKKKKDPRTSSAIAN